MNVPELRFPEFKDEWKDIKGKEIFNVLGGGAFSSKDSQDNGVKWLKIANVGINKIESNDISYLPTEYKKEYEKYLLKKEDIVIALTRPTLSSKLKIALIDEYFDNSLLNQRVGKLIPSENGIKYFIYYLLQLKKNIAYIENQISGTDPPNLSIKDLINIPLMVPSLSEQQKIVSFLLKVDEKIEKLEKKEELWQTYKKGMMQQFFSQNLRFKDENGNEYPDWEIKEAKDIFKNYSNKDHNGDLPILAVTQDKGVVDRDSVDIKIDSSPESIKSYKIIEPGDFVISLRSFQGGIEYSNIKGISSPAYTVLKPKIEILDGFYKFLFKKEEFISRLNSAVIGIRDGKQISYSVFSEMKLPYPSIPEQTKIANFLSSIDKKIENIQKELMINKEFKKGLLQQMFPSDRKSEDIKTKDLSKLEDKQERQPALL